MSTATDLYIARTLIHESFHAYLNMVVRWSGSSGNDENYVNLIHQYAEQFNNDPNDIHHFLFVKENMIKFIADALQEYGEHNGYSLTRQFYEDMSWGGLTELPAFQLLSQVDQTRILSTLSAELHHNNQNQGQISPVGHLACP